MGTEDVSPINKPIKIQMTAYSTVWGADLININEFYFYISNEFQDSFFIPSTNNELITNGWEGWDFVTSRDNQREFPAFAYGVYKVYTDESPAYFYIDFRVDRLGRYSNYQPAT